MSLDYTIPKSEIRSGRFVLEGKTWVQERTCHRLQKFGRISKCSDCGYYLGSEMNYCPNCGARVVSE